MIGLSPFLFDDVFAQQDVLVNGTEPCFLREGSIYDMFAGCGLEDDCLKFSLVGFEWITGGNFTLVLASIIIIVTYIKYHQPAYPIMIGMAMLPVSYSVYPEHFMTFAFAMVALTLSIWAYDAFIKNTRTS